MREREWRSEGEDGEVGEREGLKEWVRGWRRERLRVKGIKSLEQYNTLQYKSVLVQHGFFHSSKTLRTYGKYGTWLYTAAASFKSKARTKGLKKSREKE